MPQSLLFLGQQGVGVGAGLSLAALGQRPGTHRASVLCPSTRGPSSTASLSPASPSLEKHFSASFPLLGLPSACFWVISSCSLTGSTNEGEGKHQQVAGGVFAWQQVSMKPLSPSPALMAAESGQAELRYGQGTRGVAARPGSGRQLGNGSRGRLTPRC